LIVLSKDANKLMYNAKEKVDKGEWYYKFDYIDLDPFGGCISFMDTAIQSIKNDGIFVLSLIKFKTNFFLIKV